MIDSLLSFSVVFWLLTGYCHEGFFVQVAIDLRIIAYFSDILLEPLKKLNKYCDRRNDYVHQFEGVSSLEDEENLVRYLYKIVRQIAQIPEPNSFTILNQQLHFLLTSSL